MGWMDRISVLDHKHLPSALCEAPRARTVHSLLSARHKLGGKMDKNTSADCWCGSSLWMDVILLCNHFGHMTSPARGAAQPVTTRIAPGRPPILIFYIRKLEFLSSSVCHGSSSTFTGRSPDCGSASHGRGDLLCSSVHSPVACWDQSEPRVGSSCTAANASDCSAR